MRAIEWYNLAPEQEYQLAEVNLGLMCFHSDGLYQDRVKALIWWNVPAKFGN